jgi:hypothetical protein
MKVSAFADGCFLFLHGLAVTSPIQLAEGVELLPASLPELSPLLLDAMKSDEDRAVLMLFLPRVRSQLHITGESAKEVATRAWNAVWDAILVGAIVGCEVTCNLQANVAAEALDEKSEILVTNHHLRGLHSTPPLLLTEDHIRWLGAHYATARKMLSQHLFLDAVHALASYKWHSLPRARLAMLWAGIEGLFGIDSEIVFRLSLGVAKFLGDSASEQRQIFESTKSLYKARSRAVHGGKMKGDVEKAISESAGLLNRLIVRAAEQNQLPHLERLIF